MQKDPNVAITHQCMKTSKNESEISQWRLLGCTGLESNQNNSCNKLLRVLTVFSTFLHFQMSGCILNIAMHELRCEEVCGGSHAKNKKQNES